MKNHNLPSVIGFEIVRDEGKDYVVATEAGEFQVVGTPPAFPALQTSSAFTWELKGDGCLEANNMGAYSCWIEFSRDEDIFRVASALGASISSCSFDKGEISLIEQTAATGEQPTDNDPFGSTDGLIDLWINNDGEYLYQLFGLCGISGVYKVDDDGKGSGLTHVQELSDLPVVKTQGIVPF